MGISSSVEASSAEPSSSVGRSPAFTSTPEGHTTFLLLSDTHMRHGNIPAEKLPNDPNIVLIHAGDFSMNGTEEEIQEFDEWLGTLPYRNKIVIAGNHDRFLDPRFHELRRTGQLTGRNSKGRVDPEALDAVVPSTASIEACLRTRSLFRHCTYLENGGITINGIRIFGTPYQPNRQRVHSGFTFFDEQRLDEEYAKIPSDVDVLITHGPPHMLGDKNVFGKNVGCPLLRKAVFERVRPRFHVFGHIHTDCGMFEESGITFINGAICSAIYVASHDPFVFHVPSREET